MLRSRSHAWMYGIAAAVCLGTLAARPAAATLIAYEGFDYAIGDLAAQNGGSGFSAAWVKNGNGIGTVVEGGLTYTDSMGNQLAVTGNRGFASGQTANGDLIRDLALQGDVGGTTTWWGMIAERLSPHMTLDENVIKGSSLQLRNTATTPVERLAVGKGTTHPANTPASPIAYNWGLLHTGSPAISAYSTKPITDQAFLVVRIDHVGDSTAPDNAWLWVNPRLGQTPDIALADVSMTASTTPAAIDFSFNRVRVFAGNTTAATGPYAEFSFDEIRLGTTFADVAPIAGPGGDSDANFNQDSRVDGADFLIWQRNVGAMN